MNKIWILWDEEYSDNVYRNIVVGIFDSKEKAEVFRKNLINDDEKKVVDDAEAQGVSIESAKVLWRKYTESNLRIKSYNVK